MGSTGTGKSFPHTSKVQMVLLLAMSWRVQEATAQEAMTMQAPHEKNGGGKLPTTTHRAQQATDRRAGETKALKHISERCSLRSFHPLLTSPLLFSFGPSPHFFPGSLLFPFLFQRRQSESPTRNIEDKGGGSFYDIRKFSHPRTHFLLVR